MKRFWVTLAIFGLGLWILLFGSAENAAAANCQSGGSGDWFVAATWTNCNGAVPTAGDNVQISAGHTVTLTNSPDASIAQITILGTLQIIHNDITAIASPITINSGGTLLGGDPSQFNHFNFSGASLTNNGMAGGTINFTGTSLQRVSGSGIWRGFVDPVTSNWRNCAFNPQTWPTLQMDSNITLENCELNTSMGTLDTNGYNIIIEGTYEYPISNYGTISGSGSVIVNGRAYITQAGNFSVPLTVNNGGRVYLAGNQSYGGNITIHNGGLLIGGSFIRFSGASFANDGIASGQIVFEGNSQSISGTGLWTRFSEGVGSYPCYMMVDMNATTRLSSDITFENCELYISSTGTFNTNGRNLIEEGTYDYPITNYGTINGSGSVVINAIISIDQSGSFLAPLVVNNGGRTIITGSSSFGGSVTINSGGMLLGGSPPTSHFLFSGPSFVNNGIAGGEITYTGASQNISGSGRWQGFIDPSTLNWRNCYFVAESATTVHLNSDITLENCELITQNGGTLNTNGHNLIEEGTYDYPITNYGTINGSGSVVFNAITKSVYQSGTFLASIIINNGGRTIITGNNSFGGSVTINSGGMLLGGSPPASHFLFSGPSFVNNGTAGGEITYVGASQDISGSGRWLGFNDPFTLLWRNCYFVVESAATVRLNSDITLEDCDLLLHPGSTLQTNGYRIIFMGSGMYGLINQGVISGILQLEGSYTIRQTGVFSSTLIVTAGNVVRAEGNFLDIHISSGATLALLGDLSIYGHWTQSGALTHNQHAITFAGAGNHNLTILAPTTFYTLTVNNQVTLIETEIANNASIATGGRLITYGSGRVRKTRAVNAGGTYNFGLTGVQITVTNIVSSTPASIQVDRLEINHPNATPGIATGRYWSLTPLNASSYTVDVSLPHQYIGNLNALKVCRYSGSGIVWSCARNDATNTRVNRLGISELSEWAVGENVGPTAITLREAAIQSNRLVGWVGLAALSLIAFAIYGLRRKHLPGDKI
jgi:hypothetical protein